MLQAVVASGALLGFVKARRAQQDEQATLGHPFRGNYKAFFVSRKDIF